MEFENRVVLVTGGARGIGRACVEAFAKAGAKVVLNFRQSEAEARQVAASCGNRVVSVRADVSAEEEVRGLFAEAENRFGRVDTVVNNAGIVGRTGFPELTGEAFLDMLRVNTVGPYLVVREYAQRLGEHEGVVVNVGSMRAFVPTSVDYAASKAALHNMTVSLAKALAPQVRVNAVAPGFTNTDMHAGKGERLEAEAQKALLKRYSEPEDIAESVLFLASARAVSITGHVLLADNGRSLA